MAGTPRILLEHVSSSAFTGGFLAFSRTGTLAYLGGRAQDLRLSAFWLDTSGKTLPLYAGNAGVSIQDVRFSPEGKLLALSVATGSELRMVPLRTYGPTNW
jgi:hypothetical protein